MRQNMVAAAADLGFPAPGRANPRAIPRESGRRRPERAAGEDGWIGRRASGSNWDRGVGRRTRGGKNSTLFYLGFPWV